MRVSCLAHWTTQSRVHHTCRTPLPIPHPPTPGVIVRGSNELSWEGFRDKGLQKSPGPGGRADSAHQSPGWQDQHLLLHLRACPGSVHKARPCPGSHSCWPTQGVSDLGYAGVAGNDAPHSGFGQRTQPLESHRLGLKHHLSCSHSLFLPVKIV